MTVNNAAITSARPVLGAQEQCGNGLCFSHGGNLVGEKTMSKSKKDPSRPYFFDVKRLVKHYKQIVGRNPRVVRRFLDYADKALPSISETRWWSTHEVLNFLQEDSPVRPAEIKDNVVWTNLQWLCHACDVHQRANSRKPGAGVKYFCTLSADKVGFASVLLDMTALKIGMSPFLKFTYDIEGDDLMSFATRRRLEQLEEHCQECTEGLPGFSARAIALGLSPRLAHKLERARIEILLKTGFHYFRKRIQQSKEYESMRKMADLLSNFDTYWINYDTSKFTGQNGLQHMDNHAVTRGLVPALGNELSAYHDAIGEFYTQLHNDEFTKTEHDPELFWKWASEDAARHSSWETWFGLFPFAACIPMSSASAERVFSVLDRVLTDLNQRSLADLITLRVRTEYNESEHGVPKAFWWPSLSELNP
jgi:hypothetical protein